MSRGEMNPRKRPRLTFSLDRNDNTVCLGDAVLCRDLIGVVRSIKFSRSGRPKVIGLELPDPNGNSDGSISDANGNTVTFFQTKPNHAIFVSHKDIVRKVSSFEILSKMTRQHELMVKLANDKRESDRKSMELRDGKENLIRDLEDRDREMGEMRRRLAEQQKQINALQNQPPPPALAFDHSELNDVMPAHGHIQQHTSLRHRKNMSSGSFGSCTSSEWSPSAASRFRSFSLASAESPHTRYYHSKRSQGVVVTATTPVARGSSNITFSAPVTPRDTAQFQSAPSNNTQHFDFPSGPNGTTRYYDGMAFGEIFHSPAPSPSPSTSPAQKKVVIRTRQPALKMKSRSAPTPRSVSFQNPSPSSARRWSSRSAGSAMLPDGDDMSYYNYDPGSQRNSLVFAPPIYEANQTGNEVGLALPPELNDALKIVVTPPMLPALCGRKSIADEFRLDSSPASQSPGVDGENDFEVEGGYGNNVRVQVQIQTTVVNERDSRRDDSISQMPPGLSMSLYGYPVGGEEDEA